MNTESTEVSEVAERRSGRGRREKARMDRASGHSAPPSLFFSVSSDTCVSSVLRLCLCSWWKSSSAGLLLKLDGAHAAVAALGGVQGQAAADQVEVVLADVD